MMTLLPLRTHKLMTRHTILLHLLPMTLWQPLALQEVLRKQVGDGTIKKSRGTNLKKSGFNKAHDMVKSKDAAQCHYKWGHVSTFTLKNYSDYLLNIVAM